MGLAAVGMQQLFKMPLQWEFIMREEGQQLSSCRGGVSQRSPLQHRSRSNLQGHLPYNHHCSRQVQVRVVSLGACLFVLEISN